MPAKAVIDPALRGRRGRLHVVVQGGRSTEPIVARLGGRVTHDLSLIGGFAAIVPASSLSRIAAQPGVRSITADSAMKVMAVSPTTDVSGLQPPDVYQQVVQSDQLQAAGDAGRGVTVALIDTGVTPMADTSSQLVSVAQDPFGISHASCVNFAGDGTCNDLYGHGTFIAGLIAGTGAASDGQYAGVAPAAKVLSVKIAGADGSADVSTVIAAIQWVVAFRNTYNIKVLNLSLGTNGSQSYQLSPLDFAVEKAWQSGIVTVVSASNLGPGPSTIDKPADDPFVLTVGAIDDGGTAALSDDNVPPWSARGPTAADGLAKPDVVAPGVGLISLAAPGASITTQFPAAMDPPYRQGSGTSMSTAVVSGLVADIRSAEPAWSPDRVKFALMSTAVPDADSDPTAIGAGLVNGYAALSAPPGLANQGVPFSAGIGSLQSDRGSVQVVLHHGGQSAPLSGNLTAQLTPWNFAANLLARFNGSSWYGSSWYGSSWYGSSWYGSSWYGSSWYGSSWYGSSWYGSSWYGVWQ
ncbi:MAG TPA: S8 family serine peptidase [Mycobacteriales bacterium]|nr:S8 family serine peptidase [Mycobacteriales bacterium]